MSKRVWTKEQEQAIYAKWRNSEKTERSNVLVQAAAGSGKTAVLVERIIKKLVPDDGSEPCGVNSLLAVTFTNAAAGEMQERIGAALSKELTGAIAERDVKKQKLLKRQLALLPYADITTIDAFCLKTIRSYFHLLEIDPDFGITDSGEAGIMRDDAMEELFEQMYNENNPDFLHLICMYTDGRDDTNLSDKIKQIYEFTRSFPDPEGWLKEKCKDFENPKDSAWVNDGIKRARRLAKEAMKSLRRAAQIILESSVGGFDDFEKAMLDMPPHEENDVYLAWGSYYTAVFDEYFDMKKIIESDWNGIFEISQRKYIPLNQKADYVDKSRQIKDKDLKEQVKTLRTAAAGKVKKDIKKYISMPLEDFCGKICSELYRTVCALSDMTMRFSDIYARIKAEKNVMEFADIEHLCLKLFSEFPEVRKEYTNKYEEILMDEYQDSNRLQEEIFSLISRGDNLFMVGDMKQSIYRFRSSDPTIFKEKSDVYEKDETAKNRKIVLSKNFRSRETVLESINDVFGMIMSDEAGGIEYDDDQRLNVGDTSYRDENPDYRSECLLIEENGEEVDESIDKVRLEARVIAARICEMKASGFKVRDTEKVSFADPKTGEVKTETKTVYRPLKNKDITVLMSSYKGAAEIYTEELSAAGIDCYAESMGYFERSEIKLILALLKIIGNPYQDIPLLGVMRSPIGGFSDDDLVNIRLSGGGYIFSAMKNLVRCMENGEISDAQTLDSAKKTAVFLEKLEKWRSYTKYMTSDRLLWTVYEETDIYSFVGALYGGDEACANLRLLFERAKKYETTGYKGLFNFVRYITLLKKKNEDLTSAVTVTQNHDVVRIMTIHKSKGLEFPVVFLAGCGKKFNLSDTSGNMLLHRTLGFGLDCIDFENSIKIPNITKTVTADTIKRESISEEIRKLYVAMTRAKEKLIVTATAGKKADSAKKLEDKYQGVTALDAYEVLDAGNFISWILPSAMNCPQNWTYRRVTFAEASLGAVCVQGNSDGEEMKPERDISRYMTYEYPYKDAADVPSKVSVSEIKQKRTEKGESRTQMVPVPDFLKPKEKIKGAARGTLLHYIMQSIPLAVNMDCRYVDNFLEKLENEGKLSEEERTAIDVHAVTAFYNSPLGQRMRRSRQIFREAPFEIPIPAKMVDEEYPEGEKVILQGIIDCYFEEDGEFVVVDYKSDFYENPQEMREKYTTQIELYARAIEKITEKKVKNKYLYLFFDDNVLEL